MDKNLYLWETGLLSIWFGWSNAKLSTSKEQGYSLKGGRSRQLRRVWEFEKMIALYHFIWVEQTLPSGSFYWFESCEDVLCHNNVRRHKGGYCRDVEPINQSSVFLHLLYLPLWWVILASIIFWYQIWWVPWLLYAPQAAAASNFHWISHRMSFLTTSWPFPTRWAALGRQRMTLQPRLFDW